MQELTRKLTRGTARELIERIIKEQLTNAPKPFIYGLYKEFLLESANFFEGNVSSGDLSASFWEFITSRDEILKMVYSGCREVGDRYWQKETKWQGWAIDFVDNLEITTIVNLCKDDQIEDKRQFLICYEFAKTVVKTIEDNMLDSTGLERENGAPFPIEFLRDGFRNVFKDVAFKAFENCSYFDSKDDYLRKKYRYGK